MKPLFIFSVFLIFMSCGGNQAGKITEEQKERDAAFKDSIASVDGNKALGNIRFGVTRKEFEKENFIFQVENKFSLYGEDVQTIDGFFTDADELCRITLVSAVEKEKSPERHPYYQFVFQKFGLEHPLNNWIIGDRRIILTFENRKKDMYYAMRSQPSPKSNLFKAEPYDPFEKLNYYVMYVQNDSLYGVYQQQQAESSKQAADQRQREFQEKERSEREFRERQLQGL